MAATTTIIRGENRRLTRNLKNADGSALAVASLASAQVELIQGGAVLHTFILATDDELTEGDDGNSLVLELTSAVTAALSPALLKERYTLRITDAAYLVEPGQAIQIIELTDIQIR